MGLGRLMAIPLVALQGQPVTAGNAFLTGRDQGQAYRINEGVAQKSEDEQRVAGLSRLTNAIGYIRQGATPDEQARRFEGIKKWASANWPDWADHIQGMTIDMLEPMAAALTSPDDALKLDELRAKIGYQNAGIGLRQEQTASIGRDDARQDYKTSADVANINNSMWNRTRNTSDQMANRGARTGAYVSAPGMQPAPRPLPPALARQEQDDVDAINAASGAVQDLNALVGELESGKYELGPLANLESQFNNWAGESTPNSQFYTKLQSMLERIRNASLILNKGVQTEGDAQRAMNEIAANVNDPKVLAQQLRILLGINARALDQRQRNINLRRQNAGYGQIDTQGYQMQGTPYGPAGVAPPPPEDDLNSIIDQWAP